VEVAGSEFTEDVDLVIGAIGQRPEAISGYGVNLAKNNRVQVREDNMLTSRPGVYAGGDCVLGPSTLIESVAQGRKAAAAPSTSYLGGDGNIEEKLLPDWDTDPHIGREEGFNTASACIRSSSIRPSATTGTRSNSASTTRPRVPRPCAASSATWRRRSRTWSCRPRPGWS
jgi:hypothetical protein